jgi:hypothetical protein
MKRMVRGAVKDTRKEEHACVAWNKWKMGGFMSLFLKFKCDRWDQIRKQLEFKHPADGLKIVGQTVREWLINAVQGDAELPGGLYERELAEIHSRRRGNFGQK